MEGGGEEGRSRRSRAARHGFSRMPYAHPLLASCPRLPPRERSTGLCRAARGRDAFHPASQTRPFSACHKVGRHRRTHGTQRRGVEVASVLMAGCLLVCVRMCVRAAAGCQRRNGSSAPILPPGKGSRGSPQGHCGGTVQRGNVVPCRSLARKCRACLARGHPLGGGTSTCRACPSVPALFLGCRHSRAPPPPLVITVTSPSGPTLSIRVPRSILRRWPHT